MSLSAMSDCKHGTISAEMKFADARVDRRRPLARAAVSTATAGRSAP
jgi:hypothetical protein